MRIIEKISVVLCLVVAVSVDTVIAGTNNGGYTFNFDNGAGLHGSATHSFFSSRHGAFLPQNGLPVSQFFIHQDYGGGALHYGGTVSEDERHYYGGLSLGGTTLAYFQGSGKQFSKAPNTLYEDLNQYFFHGGTRLPFEFRGLAADIGIGNGFSAQFAATEVTAPNVEDRHGYYTGVANRYFKGGVFQLERGGERVGQGLNLGVGTSRLDLAYQDIQSEYDVRVRRVALEWNESHSRSFSIEFEQVTNDLFSRDDEQRVMLRFRKRLGREPAFNTFNSNYAGDGGQGSGAGFNRAVGTGVGLGIAANSVSSGSSVLDSAQRFAFRDSAAFTVMNRINPVSVRQNREYGGWIFRSANNTFGFTEPIAGRVASVNIGIPELVVPPGTIASASYHTHGGPDPRFDNENFSPQDLIVDRFFQVDGYLGTPAGFLKLFNFRTGAITIVGRINN